jgi:hypothetical protein
MRVLAGEEGLDDGLYVGVDFVGFDVDAAQRAEVVRTT